MRQVLVKMLIFFSQSSDTLHCFTCMLFQNFYLIDPHLVAFIVTVLSRRLLLSITLAVLRQFIDAKLMPHATIAAR